MIVKIQNVKLITVFSIADYNDERVRKVSVPPPSGVPTLSQWGLIIFTLLLLSMGMVFMYNRQNAMLTAAPFGGAQGRTQSDKYFENRLYFKTLGIVLPLAFCGLVAARWYYGALNATDTVGTIASACIVAYMIHLLAIGKDSGR